MDYITKYSINQYLFPIFSLKLLTKLSIYLCTFLPNPKRAVCFNAIKRKIPTKRLRRGMKKNSFSCDHVFLSLIFTLILAVGTTVLLAPPKSFSERENRRLQSFPIFSASALTSGSFAHQLSSFYSDQLPFRTQLGNLYALSELSLGKSECNGVAVCKDNTLVQLPQKHSQGSEILKGNLLAIEELEQKMRDKAVFLFTPSSFDAFKEQIPALLRGIDDSVLAELECELSDELLSKIHRSEKPYEYYYRTDHHWTTQGAYTAYALLSDSLGYVAQDESFFEKEVVSESFFGTSLSKSALPEGMFEPDTVTLYRYGGDGKVCVDNGDALFGLYDFSALNGYDKYRVFLGGNYAHISIYTPNEGRENLLLIKDSFANSLIPFLSLHFDVEAIDPRYATPSQLQKLCESKSFDKILVLCSSDTVMNEKALGRFLKIIE